MEIGNQIKALRLRRGITQETVAEHFGISPQAVSKWERGTASPDIAMLPGISAYFGVTIDELFALSDDTRMERIQNMLWDVRELDRATVENERRFLLDKASREPKQVRALELLADLENHLAREHRAAAAAHAREALRRDPGSNNAHGELIDGLGGFTKDWAYSNHSELIDFYKDHIRENPQSRSAYIHLLDQLLDDWRLSEAREYCARFAEFDTSYRPGLYRAMLSWYEGRREEAFDQFRQVAADHPGEWYVEQTVGDFYVYTEQYAEAIVHYRRALSMQSAPRWTDPIESIAQAYERMGDIPAAIAAWQEELKLFEEEWHFTEGETADAVRRQIARLEQKREIFN